MTSAFIGRTFRKPDKKTDNIQPCNRGASAPANAGAFS